MKCFTHPEKDAVSFCQSCGNGLCNDCRVSIAGISYCQPCLDAGRIRQATMQVQDPEDRLPSPTGPVNQTTRLYFTLGIIGLIIIAVSIHIVWLAPILSPVLVYPSDLTNLVSFLPRTIGLMLVAIGISLTGLAFGELKNYFNYRLGFYIGLYSIVSPWILVISDILVYTGLVYLPGTWPYSWQPGPLAPLSSSFYIIGGALIGVLFILWPYALLSLRRETMSRSATKWASALLLIVAHMLLISVPILFILLFRSFVYYPFYYGFFYPGLSAFDVWQAALIEPAVLIMAYIFNRLRVSLKP